MGLCVRFIRDDEAPSDVSWEERLARAYESKLFKEFALVSFTSSEETPSAFEDELDTDFWRR